MLADCSHSSAVAVGQRCRLAFHKDGLHAFGGYLEGFLPQTFAVEAVAGDDKILAFLQLNDLDIELKQTKTKFILRRGEAEVRFEAAADVPMPSFPQFMKPTELELPTPRILEALLEVAPKTGWGALNAEMLGVVLTENGATSTDNTSLGWAPEFAYDVPIILPRPFVLAYIRWHDKLGDKVRVATDGTGVMAAWDSGEMLYGVLPASPKIEMDFSALFTETQEVPYIPLPEGFKDLLDEAAIFADDVLMKVTGKTMSLETVGPVSWHREVLWEGPGFGTFLTLPLKRLRTALDYADTMGVVDNRVHLSTENQDLHVIIASK